MSGFPQSLSMSGLKLQVAMTHITIPPSHGERYRVYWDYDIIPRGCSVKGLDVLPRDQPRSPSPRRRSSPMTVEREQKIPGLGVVVKQQIDGHGPHANHRDPRNGPWSDLGSNPSGGRQIVGNPSIPWLLEWREIVEINRRDDSVSLLARRKSDAIFAIGQMAIRKRSGPRRRTNRTSLAVCLPCRRYLHVFHAAIILNFNRGDSRDRSGLVRKITRLRNVWRWRTRYCLSQRSICGRSGNSLSGRSRWTTSGRSRSG